MNTCAWMGAPLWAKTISLFLFMELVLVDGSGFPIPCVVTQADKGLAWRTLLQVIRVKSIHTELLF